MNFHNLPGRKGYLFQRTISAVKYQIIIDISNSNTIQLELDDSSSPNTVKSFLECLPTSNKSTKDLEFSSPIFMGDSSDRFHYPTNLF
jgi:hypothetical protein